MASPSHPQQRMHGRLGQWRRSDETRQVVYFELALPQNQESTVRVYGWIRREAHLSDAALSWDAYVDDGTGSGQYIGRGSRQEAQHLVEAHAAAQAVDGSGGC